MGGGIQRERRSDKKTSADESRYVGSDQFGDFLTVSVRWTSGRKGDLLAR